jgi:hypothetical protein
MTSCRPLLFRKRKLEPDVIVTCIPRYLRFSLSLRDLEELMAERCLAVDHTSIWRWVQAYSLRGIVAKIRAYATKQLVDNCIWASGSPLLTHLARPFRIMWTASIPCNVGHAVEKDWYPLASQTRFSVRIG